MKERFVRVMVIMTLMFTWLGFNTSTASAVGCSGLNCKGLDPYTMGCSASTSGTVKILPDGYSRVETRVSSATNCNAKWARAYNLSGSSKWVAADIKCGSGYPSCQFRASSAKIASSSTVGIYTPMTPFATTQTKSCGVVRASPGPITTVPLGNANCTAVN
jgi:hypothetical protein